MLRVLNISQGTSVDGPGLRTSIYFAGCHHQCPGCHNPESWSFEGGEERTVEEIMEVVRYNRFPVTFSGGDPLYIAKDLIPLAREIRMFFNAHPEYIKPSPQGESRRGASEDSDVLWIYSGFRYEDVKDRDGVRELFEYADVLVDGPYVDALNPHSVSGGSKGAPLRFRGSSNQRFIDLRTGKSFELD